MVLQSMQLGHKMEIVFISGGLIHVAAMHYDHVTTQIRFPSQLLIQILSIDWQEEEIYFNT